MYTSGKARTETTNDGLVGCLGMIVILVFGSLWGGYVLSILWRWFIVGPFHAPVLSIPATIGVALVIRFLAPSNTKPDKNQKMSEYVVEQLSKAALIPLCALLFGWIITWFL